MGCCVLMNNLSYWWSRQIHCLWWKIHSALFVQVVTVLRTFLPNSYSVFYMLWWDEHRPLDNIGYPLAAKLYTCNLHPFKFRGSYFLRILSCAELNSRNVWPVGLMSKTSLKHCIFFKLISPPYLVPLFSPLHPRIHWNSTPSTRSEYFQTVRRLLNDYFTVDVPATVYSPWFLC